MALLQTENNSIFANLVKHNNFSEEIKQKLYHLWCSFLFKVHTYISKTP